MVRWVLGPLADPGFEAEFARKQAAATAGARDWRLPPHQQAHGLGSEGVR